MCQRAPRIPNLGTMNDLAASSARPFGATSISTPLVPADAPHAKAAFGDAMRAASTDLASVHTPSTADLRYKTMAAEAAAVEAKRSMGWSKLTSIIPQVQCGMNYIVENPFYNRGYVQCGLLNQEAINGQIVGDGLSTPPTVPPAGRCGTKGTKKHYSNFMGGKPHTAYWWPKEWHGDEGRYGTAAGTWTSATSQMPQYVPGRSGYMVDPWGAAHLN